MKKNVFVIFLLLKCIITHGQILIVRENEKDLLVTGTISWNGEVLGKTFENASTLIPAGKYSCKLRVKSDNNFVQGPFGIMMNTGDFLLEITNVPNFTNILLHTGSKPYHSKGCILLGPINGDLTGYYIGQDHPLYKLRVKIFGSESKPKSFNDDNPNITLSIIDVVSTMQKGSYDDHTNKTNTSKNSPETCDYHCKFCGIKIPCDDRYVPPFDCCGRCCSTNR